MKVIMLTAIATAAAAAVTAVAPAAAAPARPAPDDGATAVAGSYLAVFKDGAAAAGNPGQITELATRLAARAGGRVARTYRHALRGFELAGDAEAARRLAADPAVAFVEQNRQIRVTDTQQPTPSWGLDRIDQRTPPLDASYTYPNLGAGVQVYVIDTGIQISHPAFGGRARYGFNAMGTGPAVDCHGHGTHTAGTVGSEPYGVAKGVTLVAVKVFDCFGRGDWADLVAGIDFVIADHDATEPAVANMSITGEFFAAANTAVANLVADGVTVAVAAGNGITDACRTSPASEPSAITVGATGGMQGGPGGNDTRASFSNFGSCVDIFAPGVNIASAWLSGGTAARSGTSMASPHVAGAAAMILGEHPDSTPQHVADALFTAATTGSVQDPGPGSPNRLLYVVNGAPAADFAIMSTAADVVVDHGGAGSTTITTTVTAGGPQPVTLTATGLPPGATATFTPAAVASGGSADLTLDVSAATAPGTYAVTVTGTGQTAVRAATLRLVVPGQPGCAQTAGGDVAIPDLSAAEGLITIAGCAAIGELSSVEVRIAHSDASDLALNLIAPDGSAYQLRNVPWTADGIHQVYPLALSGESADGLWRLRVSDTGAGNTGRIDSWALSLAEPAQSPQVCASGDDADVEIGDIPGRWVSSLAPIAECARIPSSTSTVEVHIVHPNPAELTIQLGTPDNQTITLLDAVDGTGANIDQTFTLDLSRQLPNGVWHLWVRDNVQGTTGHIDSWQLTI